ncbi:MAG TPA: cytochrome c3 family protein, partial [Thermodesulfobacteriota bacterium]|nr:cytochrome c3 family protein [Thermodesulfobacteriota bacterium]
GAVGLAALALTGAARAPRGPAQPIAFSHRLHAGQYQIPCLYCHYSAGRSPWVNVPSAELCMGCHKITAAGRPEIQKLARYWNERRPIPWIRVHHLPEFVRFTHKRHVQAGFACETCHGPVREMDVVYQYSTLTMGWCVNCHNGQNELRKKASLDCFTCHY